MTFDVGSDDFVPPGPDDPDWDAWSTTAGRSKTPNLKHRTRSALRR